MLTQYDFACCNLEIDSIHNSDYKSTNPMITISGLCVKIKLILRVCMKLKNENSDEIETPNTPMVMNITDTMNDI